MSEGSLGCGRKEQLLTRVSELQMSWSTRMTLPVPIYLERAISYSIAFAVRSYEIRSLRDSMEISERHQLF